MTAASPEFSEFLSSTACKFLSCRGSNAGLSIELIERICFLHGITLSETQAAVLHVFGGLQYRPLGSDGCYNCFSDWTFPDQQYERGFVSNGAQWISRCYDNGDFGPEGLYMDPDGGLGLPLGDAPIVVYRSLTIPIERDATVWAANQPFVGVVFLHERFTADELDGRIPGKRIVTASDHRNCVWMSDTSVCIWSGWTPAIDRAFKMPTVPGTRLDVFASSHRTYEKIVMSLETAGVVNNAFKRWRQ